MATHKPAKPDEQQVKDAEKLWNSFTQLSKYSVIVTVVILAILGLAFIDW